jgi:hypothetical protein
MAPSKIQTFSENKKFVWKLHSRPVCHSKNSKPPPIDLSSFDIDEFRASLSSAKNAQSFVSLKILIS